MPKANPKSLERRLVLWHRGDTAALVKEGKCIQDHLHHSIHNLARIFNKLMSLGKVSAALKLLSEDAKGVLPLNSKVPCGQDGDGSTLWKSVKDILAEKHPPGHTANAECLLESDDVNAPCYDPVLFDQLTGDVIKWAALRTKGTAGPSSVDAYAWQRLCSSFGSASVSLCNSLAAVARCLCVHEVN